MYIETVTGRSVNIADPTADQISVEDIAWALSRIARFAGHTVTEIPYNVAQHSVYVSKLAHLVSGLSVDEIAALGFSSIAEYQADYVLSFRSSINALLTPTEMELVRNELAIRALFHDGHEAYLGDMPTPVKKSSKEFYTIVKQIEGRLDEAIFAKIADTTRIQFLLYSGLESRLTQDEIKDLRNMIEDYIYLCLEFADKFAQSVEAYQFMKTRGEHWAPFAPSLIQIQQFSPPVAPIDAYEQFLRRFADLRSSSSAVTMAINK